jgi:hypothetical protein
MTSPPDPLFVPPADPCPEDGGKEWGLIGATPAGALVACMSCGHEQIAPDPGAEAVAAERDEQVAEEGADVVVPILVGPLSTGELQRLRHPEQVAALEQAAGQGLPNMDMIVVWLRNSGFEVVATDRVFCDCIRAAGGLTRSPVCPIHGDVA